MATMTNTAEQAATTAEPSTEQTLPRRGVSALTLAMSALVGVYFGIVLTKSEVVRWQRVHDMFLFREAHMYLIIGVIIGGILFGAGWAITGACPGPIYAQLGGGAWMALFTLTGAIGGMYLFAFLKPYLPN